MTLDSAINGVPHAREGEAIERYRIQRLGRVEF